MKFTRPEGSFHISYAFKGAQYQREIPYLLITGGRGFFSVFEFNEETNTPTTSHLIV